jgi:hypothetical protein
MSTLQNKKHRDAITNRVVLPIVLYGCEIGALVLLLLMV